MLNLPPFQLRVKTEKGKKSIFDVIRKKYVSLTPEEWVRQHFIHFLLQLNYPASLMAVEKLVVVNELRQRADIVVFNRKGKPALIVECKAPTIKLSNNALHQAARYNIPLGVKYLVITNGLKHYCVKLDKSGNDFKVVDKMPDIESLQNH